MTVSSMRRGACPSLSIPMATGDGLLARINPVEGKLSAAQLLGLAQAVQDCGNGIVEVTARGSLQLRGLTDESARRLSEQVAALRLNMRSGLPVEIGPLAGLDATEAADPRGLAREIGEQAEALGLSSRLAPKVSVTVDGGGAIGLRELSADVKLEAEDDSAWCVRVGGTSGTARVLGHYAPSKAMEITVRILQTLTARGKTARARDLSNGQLATIAGRQATAAETPAVPVCLPVGRFALAGGAQARGVALVHGQIESGALAAFATACGEREIRLSPGHGLIVLDLARKDDAPLRARAEEFGLVVRPDDPRLFTAACVGAPACASAHLATRTLAQDFAARHGHLLDGTYRLHLSGCAKGCARPPAPAVTLTGGADRHLITGEGMPVPRDLRTALAELAGKPASSTERQRA